LRISNSIEDNRRAGDSLRVARGTALRQLAPCRRRAFPLSRHRRDFAALSSSDSGIDVVSTY
jgi:hypothetical protein